MRALLAFIFKLLVFFRIISHEEGRSQENLQLTNSLEISPGSHPTAEIVKEDRILPCLQRLERLEMIIGEISNKPIGIPLDKEHMILESLDRIKSVEFDLEKTKKVMCEVLAISFSLNYRTHFFKCLSFENMGIPG